ncbi:MAG TPA: hypothetical protein PKH58_10160, partial [Paludibacteraceae bacterium]|nr:hypothetical protein [Paludibacteraceae bacterium]
AEKDAVMPQVYSARVRRRAQAKGEYQSPRERISACGREKSSRGSGESYGSSLTVSALIIKTLTYYQRPCF